MLQLWISIFLVLLSSIQCESLNDHFPVQLKCSKKLMQIVINIEDNSKNSSVYLEKLKDYPPCQPKTLNGKVTFSLPIDDNFYYCGTTKVKDKLTASKIYYNKIVIEDLTNQSKHIFIAKCMFKVDQSLRSKRQLGSEWELPENFTESVEELIDYSGNYTSRAPVPFLNIAVRQNGRFVDTAINVQPGTPLEMIIYLDEASSPIYGLLASFLKVTDNTPRRQEEIIILEGCSIDPYIFSNFEASEGGNSISAKFRAFKFPESNYVLFVGTVNVCLKECLGVQCGNGLLGYGRKKRSIHNHLPDDPNKVFEIEMTTFLKVDFHPYHKKSSMLAGTINNKFFEEYRLIRELDEVKLNKFEPKMLPKQDRLQSENLSLKFSKNGQKLSYKFDGILIYLLIFLYWLQ